MLDENALVEKSCATGSASAEMDGRPVILKHWQSQWHTRMLPLTWRGSFRQPTIVFHQTPRPATIAESPTSTKDSLR